MSVPPASPKTLRKVPFKNVDTQNVPAFGVMQITGSVVEDGVTFLTCAKPGAALATQYAVNGQSQVYPGEKGVCHREGDVRVLFDSGAPAAGEAWGVRATQWSLSKGYPAIVSVHGVQSVTGFVLFGRLGPLGAVMGSAAVDLAASSSGTPGTGSVGVLAWDGTRFSAASPAMSLTGYNSASSLLKAGATARFAQTEGLWVSTGADAPVVRFELTADLAYGVDPTSDNAKLLVYSSGAYAPTGATIRVYDWTRDATADGGAFGNWSGKRNVTSPARSGYQGWAVLAPDSARYEVVWLEQQAQFIQFRLYSALATTDASQSSVTVTAYWSGRDPDPTAAGVTIYNMAASSGYAYSGQTNDVGYAVWDEKLAHYRIVAMKPRAAAGSQLGKTTTSHATGDTRTINLWTGTPGSEVVSYPLRTVDACNRTNSLIGAGKFVEVITIDDNGTPRSYCVPWEC